MKTAACTVTGGCTPQAIADAGPDRTVDEGDSTTLGTPAQAGHTYSWSPGGATTAEVVVSPAVTTTYTVTATTSCGSAQDSVTVTVLPTGGGGPQDAVYDASLGVPACAIAGSSCDSGGLLDSRDSLSPAEPNQPNTLDACDDGTSGTYHSDESNDRLAVSTLDSGNFTEGDTVEIAATVFAWSTGSQDTLDLYYAADAANPTWVFIASLTTSTGGTQTLTTQYTLPTGTLQAVRANFRYQGAASTCSAGAYDDHDDLVFAVDAAAQCTGDTDGDGTCDELDSCPGSDDSADSDGDGIPDGCDSCPAGLILTAQEVISTVVYETCASITASDGFHILAPGNVTFRAGSQVILGSGFSVRPGATFKIEIDPALVP